MEIKKIWHQLSLKIGTIKRGCHLKDYIKKFNLFLVKNIKLDSNSEILDIGCGRGKILGSLSSKLKLKNKPLGIDLINHKDKDKRINFKKINALKFFLNNKRNLI